MVHVVRRVLVKEADRYQCEARVFDRHNRPVLRSRHVRDAVRVPDDHVRVLDGPVCRSVGRQARAARMAVGKRAGASVNLIGRVWCHPQVVARERAALAGKRVLAREKSRRRLRQELVAHRIADPVLR